MANPRCPQIRPRRPPAKIASQFRGLNPNDPASWPIVPRGACLACRRHRGRLWFVWLTSSDEELEANEEGKGAQGRLLQEARAGRQPRRPEEAARAGAAVRDQLEKQLPSKAEMDALLSDINQAGLGRSLSFELFRPGQVSVKEYYAELPISVKVTGRYHDIGSFASDIATCRAS
jgi:type IV pilus assembly protein PilO